MRDPNILHHDLGQSFQQKEKWENPEITPQPKTALSIAGATALTCQTPFLDLIASPMEKGSSVIHKIVYIWD